MMVVRDVPNTQSYIHTQHSRAHIHKRLMKIMAFRSLFQYFISSYQEIITINTIILLKALQTHQSALAVQPPFFRKQIHIDKKLKLCTSADYSNELLILALELKESQIRKKKPDECMIGFVGLKVTMNFVCVNELLFKFMGCDIIAAIRYVKCHYTTTCLGDYKYT